jgi:hypothetical protein
MDAALVEAFDSYVDARIEAMVAIALAHRALDEALLVLLPQGDPLHPEAPGETMGPHAGPEGRR